MDFWKQRLGGDWRLVAAVQQPSLESGGSQIDVFLSEYNIFDLIFDPLQGGAGHAQQEKRDFLQLQIRRKA